MSNHRRVMLAFGIPGALTGLAFGSFDPVIVPLVAFVAAGGTARLLWRFAGRPVPSVLRGALLGFVIGLVSFLPVGLLLPLAWSVQRMSLDSFNELMGKAFLIVYFGLIFLGLITAPLGACVGAALAAWEARRARRAQSTEAEASVAPPAA